MSDLHPHWQSDAIDKQSAGVRVAVKQEHENISMHSVSRTPAAIVGILTMLAIGMTVFGGWDALTGQTPPASPAPNDAIEIHLTTDGPVPASITTVPGKTIVWINDDSIPHILESSTLKNASGTNLYTPAIFPGARFAVVIDPAQPNGNNDYNSITSSTLRGTIIISRNDSTTSTAASAAASSRKQAFGGTDGVPLPGYNPDSHNSRQPSDTLAPEQSAPAPVVAQTTTSSQSPVIQNANPTILPADNVQENADADTRNSASPSDTQDLPYNPYTVAATGNNAGSPLAANVRNAPRQPDAGPELWLSILVSLGMMTLFVRTSMRGTRM